MLQNIITVLTVIGGTIVVLDAYSKVNALVHQARLRDTELNGQLELIRKDVDHQADKIDTHFHGLKDSLDHLKLRFGTDLKEVNAVLKDVENYLQKNTPYEKRSH